MKYAFGQGLVDGSTEKMFVNRSNIRSLNKKTLFRYTVNSQKTKQAELGVPHSRIQVELD